eukprot:2568167-Rhodomonas_salina.1
MRASACGYSQASSDGCGCVCVCVCASQAVAHSVHDREPVGGGVAGGRGPRLATRDAHRLAPRRRRPAPPPRPQAPASDFHALASRNGRGARRDGSALADEP